MSTAFKPIEIPPGVVAKPTKQMRSTAWAEVNLMRWVESRLTPVGGQAQLDSSNNNVQTYSTLGWTSSSPNIPGVLTGLNIFPGMKVTLTDSGATVGKFVLSYSGSIIVLTANALVAGPVNTSINISGGNYFFASRCKRIHGWFGLDQVYRIAYLCEAHLYVDVGGTLTDISPASAIVPPALAGAGGYGDGLYGVGMQIQTTAFAAGATAITMQAANPGWIQPTMDVYNMTTSQHIGTVATYTGTALTLSAGADNPASAGDQLMFDWYGYSRHLVNTIAALDKAPNAYSLDNFGSILYAMTSSDGRLLMWDPHVGGAAVVQPADTDRGPVPEGRCFVVTNERYIMIFGTAGDGTSEGGKPNRFAWCDQENPGAWDYSSVTSMAGFLDIEPASPIICAYTTRNGVILFTAKKAYNSQYLGMPYIYNSVEIRARNWHRALVAAEHFCDVITDGLDVEAGCLLFRRHLDPARELPRPSVGRR